MPLTVAFFAEFLISFRISHFHLFWLLLIKHVYGGDLRTNCVCACVYVRVCIGKSSLSHGRNISPIAYNCFIVCC